MARLWSSGFELNSLTVGVEFSEVQGTAGISSSIVRSGGFSGRTQGGGVNFFGYQFAAANSNGPYFFRTYLRIVTAPDSDSHVLWLNNSTGTRKFSVVLTSSQKLQLFDDTAQIGSDSYALSLDTWYRIEVRWFNNTSSTKVEILGKINGLEFASTTISSDTGGATIFKIGNVAGAPSTYDYYFDDIAINDSTGSFQTSYPAEGYIIHVKPNATGDSNGFLVAVGGTAGAGNNFTRVNETTPDDATSYNGSALLSAEDLFDCASSGLTASDKVSLVQVGVRMADLVGADASAAFKVEIEKTSGGTKSQSGTLIPNSTTWLTNASAVPKNYPLTAYQDPDGADWTSSTIDSMQIGYILTATNVQTIAVSTIWALVEYKQNIIYNHTTTTYNQSTMTYLGISTGTTHSISITNNLGLTDVLVRVGSFAPSIQNIEGMTENVSRVVPAVRENSDAEGLTENITISTSYIRDNQDTEGLLDTLLREYIYNFSIQDNLGLTDLLSSSAGYARSIADSEGITDSLVYGLVFLRSIVDNLGITDALIREKIINSSIVDIEGLLDVLSKVLREGDVGTAKFYAIENIRPIMEIIDPKGTFVSVYDNRPKGRVARTDATVSDAVVTVTYNQSNIIYNSPTTKYGVTPLNSDKLEMELSIKNVKPVMMKASET